MVAKVVHTTCKQHRIQQYQGPCADVFRSQQTKTYKGMTRLLHTVCSLMTHHDCSSGSRPASGSPPRVGEAARNPPQASQLHKARLRIMLQCQAKPTHSHQEALPGRAAARRRRGWAACASNPRRPPAPPAAAVPCRRRRAAPGTRQPPAPSSAGTAARTPRRERALLLPRCVE